ncbi:MAG: transcription antitermination factor NusB [Lachnospiraceae bacterium]|jgi:N utilization substance protein B|nr:transcription antitermination factor NusB [Lachnospiraceae bacterium]
MEEKDTIQVTKMSRSARREQVFVALFISGFYEVSETDEALSNYFDMQDYSDEIRDSILTRYRAVKEQEGTIDSLLSGLAVGWDLSRMGRAEINILRQAVYEILFDEDIPEKVAANEAVELAKKYGGTEASGFVNGILGKVIRKNHESDI